MLPHVVQSILFQGTCPIYKAGAGRYILNHHMHVLLISIGEVVNHFVTTIFYFNISIRTAREFWLSKVCHVALWIAISI